MSDLVDRLAAELNVEANGDIPALVHHAWLDGALPSTFHDHDLAWKKLMPSWTHITWRAAPEKVHNAQLWNEAIKRAPVDHLRFRSDILRLELLYRFGGIYVDCDIEPLTPLDPLLRHGAFLVGSKDNEHMVSNFCLGATPHHPFIERCLKQLKRSSDIRTGTPIVDQVGRGFLTRMWLTWDEDIYVLDPQEFDRFGDKKGTR